MEQDPRSESEPDEASEPELETEPEPEPDPETELELALEPEQHLATTSESDSVPDRTRGLKVGTGGGVLQSLASASEGWMEDRQSQALWRSLATTT